MGKNKPEHLSLHKRKCEVFLHEWAPLNLHGWCPAASCRVVQETSYGVCFAKLPVTANPRHLSACVLEEFRTLWDSMACIKRQEETVHWVALGSRNCALGLAAFRCTACSVPWRHMQALVVAWGWQWGYGRPRGKAREVEGTEVHSTPPERLSLLFSFSWSPPWRIRVKRRSEEEEEVNFTISSSSY